MGYSNLGFRTLFLGEYIWVKCLQDRTAPIHLSGREDFSKIISACVLQFCSSLFMRVFPILLITPGGNRCDSWGAVKRRMGSIGFPKGRFLGEQSNRFPIPLLFKLFVPYYFSHSTCFFTPSFCNHVQRRRP